MKNIILIFLVLVFFTSCSKFTNTYPLNLEKSRYKNNKDYKIGGISTALVGEPLFMLKNVEVNEYSAVNINPANNFVIKSKDREFIISKDITYKVKGDVLKDNIEYKAVPIYKKDKITYYMLINQNKILIPFLLKNDEFIPITIDDNPMIFLTNIIVDVPKEDTLNIKELIYSGLSPNGFKLLVHKHSGKNESNETIVYGTTKKLINFENFLIEIFSYNEKKIVYRIVKDNYTNQE